MGKFWSKIKNIGGNGDLFVTVPNLKLFEVLFFLYISIKDISVIWIFDFRAYSIFKALDQKILISGQYAFQKWP